MCLVTFDGRIVYIWIKYVPLGAELLHDITTLFLSQLFEVAEEAGSLCYAMW